MHIIVLTSIHFLFSGSHTENYYPLTCSGSVQQHTKREIFAIPGFNVREKKKEMQLVCIFSSERPVHTHLKVIFISKYNH